MKRYGILLVSTLLLAMGIRVAGSLVREEVPVVEYRVTQAQTVEDRVVCSGKIESAQSEKVYVSMPCIAGEVYVQAGDAVKKGQKLFSVDVGATQQVLAALGESVGALAIDNIEEEITSPVDGIVTALNVVQGEAAEPGRGLCGHFLQQCIASGGNDRGKGHSQSAGGTGSTRQWHGF